MSILFTFVCIIVLTFAIVFEINTQPTLSAASRTGVRENTGTDKFVGTPLSTIEKLGIATAANSLYFDTLLTLIASIHRNDARKLVHTIIVYDLGLNEVQKNTIGKLHNVVVKTIPAHLLVFPEAATPKQYAWKAVCILDASTDLDYVIWVDAGAMFLKDVSNILDIIVSNDIFLVQDTLPNREWTSEKCREIMRCSTNELLAPCLWAGMSGFKTNGKYRGVLLEYVMYSHIKECVFGEHRYSEEYIAKTGIIGHRHDQSILSILAVRYQCPTQDIEIYGNYRLDVKELSSTDAVIFEHRGRYHNTDGLIGDGP